MSHLLLKTEPQGRTSDEHHIKQQSDGVLMPHCYTPDMTYAIRMNIN